MRKNSELIAQYSALCWGEAMKKIFMFLPVIAVLGGGAVQAQQPKTIPRIGYLSASEPAVDSRGDEIRAALRELGYIEGRTIIVEYRYARGKTERAPELASELARLKVDLIVIIAGDTWIRAAMEATKTIPIVMGGAGLDPVQAGHVESLARPRGNVTGVTNLTGEIGGKRLELFKEAVPKLVRVAVLHDPGTQASVQQVKEVLPAAVRALRLSIQPWDVRGADDFNRVFSEIGRERPDGLYVSLGPLLNSNRKRIAEYALRNRLPSIHVRKEFIVAGGLMSYGADEAASARRVAYYVDRILKGAKPGDLPVEQPSTFELAINLKTAKQIGVTIPQTVLYKADKVIK
jgi:putative ABC transport system substrate-binding protein